VTNFHSIKTKKILKELKISLKKRHITPGPGSYLAPSDFGYVSLSPMKEGSFVRRKKKSTHSIALGQAQATYAPRPMIGHSYASMVT